MKVSGIKGIIGDFSGLKINNLGLRDVNVLLVLPYKPKGLIWTTHDPSELNLAL